MRRCPFADCGAKIPEDRFACAKDWRRLNFAQQRTIYSAYDDYLAGAIDVEELRQIQGKVLEEVQRRPA
jgi:hypothetical protein